MKPIIVIAALLLCWYVGDAIYPEWSWDCKAKSIAGISVSGNTPAGFEGENRRAVNPDRPAGCTLRADNGLRRMYDSFFV